MSKTLTPTEFAAEVKSDGRTVRKFLRSITPTEAHPGKGARWALPGTAREVTKMKKQFSEWSASQETEKAARAEKAAEVAEVEEIEDEALLELED